jgi:hypothetical protein
VKSEVQSILDDIAVTAQKEITSTLKTRIENETLLKSNDLNLQRFVERKMHDFMKLKNLEVAPQKISEQWAEQMGLAGAILSHSISNIKVKEELKTKKRKSEELMKVQMKKQAMDKAMAHDSNSSVKGLIQDSMEQFKAEMLKQMKEMMQNNKSSSYHQPHPKGKRNQRDTYIPKPNTNRFAKVNDFNPQHELNVELGEIEFQKKPPLKPKRKRKRKNKRLFTKTFFKCNSLEDKATHIFNNIPIVKLKPQLTNMNFHVIGKVPPPPNSFLGYGVKFTPIPRIDKDKYDQETDQFLRLLRIRWHFKDENEQLTQKQLKYRIPNPQFIPPKAPLQFEEAFSDFKKQLKTQLKNTRKIKIDMNQIAEMKELKQYLKDNNVIVRNADKNIGLTVMSKEWYHTEAMNQMKNQKLYKVLSKEELMQKLKTISDVLQNTVDTGFNEGMIDRIERKFLLSKMDQFEISTWYHLPKIHKQSEGKPITGRPITPSHSFITSPASRWVSDKLAEVVKKQKHVLKDTQMFIKHIDDQRINNNAFLFTADVESLYPNIPWDFGLSSVAKYWLNAFPNSMQELKFILSLLKLTNENNIFQYELKFYQQQNGTAMGFSHGPQFANISLLKIDEIASEMSSKIGNGSFLNKNADCVWLRFIDDVFGVWNGTEESLKLFIEKVNGINKAFKFNFEYSKTSIDFLDVKVFKQFKNGKTFLNVKTHQKTLNNYLYVPFNSFHPYANKIAWIKTELLRYVRTCSQPSDFLQIREAFFYRLCARGYPTRILLPIFNEVHHNMRPLLFEKNEESKTSPGIPLIFKTVYNPLSCHINLKDLLSQLTLRCKELDTESNKVFETVPLICYKQPPSLLNICNTIEKRKKDNVSVLIRNLFHQRFRCDTAQPENHIYSLFKKGARHIESSKNNRLSSKKKPSQPPKERVVGILISDQQSDLIEKGNSLIIKNRNLSPCTTKDDLPLPNVNGTVVKPLKNGTSSGPPKGGLLERLGYTNTSTGIPKCPLPKSIFQHAYEKVRVWQLNNTSLLQDGQQVAHKDSSNRKPKLTLKIHSRSQLKPKMTAMSRNNSESNEMSQGPHSNILPCHRRKQTNTTDEVERPPPAGGNLSRSDIVTSHRRKQTNTTDEVERPPPAGGTLSRSDIVTSHRRKQSLSIVGGDAMSPAGDRTAEGRPPNSKAHGADF